jgi:hypothetical protein
LPERPATSRPHWNAEAAPGSKAASRHDLEARYATIDNPSRHSSGAEGRSHSECPHCSAPLRVETARRIRRPSPALVVSLIALFVSLGGGAYAALNLPANSVGTKQLKNGAVSSPKLAPQRPHRLPTRVSGRRGRGVRLREGQRLFFEPVHEDRQPSGQIQLHRGGVVELKRVSTGVYDVHFGGLGSLTTGPNLIAVGNQSVDPLGQPVVAGSLSFQLRTDSSRGGAIVYRVTLTGAGGTPVDNEFSFALLSPQ